MRPDPEETADLVTFTEEMLNGKFHFLYKVYRKSAAHNYLTLQHKKNAMIIEKLVPWI